MSQGGCGVIEFTLPSLDERLFWDPDAVPDDPIVGQMYVCPGRYARETTVGIAGAQPEWTVLPNHAALARR